MHFVKKFVGFRIREKPVMNSLQDVESKMINNSASLLAPIASSETLESSAAISRPLSAFIEKNDVKPMAIVKPRPQSEVLEEELEKPSLPPKKVINYKNGPLPCSSLILNFQPFKLSFVQSKAM